MDIFNHKHHKALLMRILVPLILAPLSLALKAIGTAHGVLSALRGVPFRKRGGNTVGVCSAYSRRGL